MLAIVPSPGGVKLEQRGYRASAGGSELALEGLRLSLQKHAADAARRIECSASPTEDHSPLAQASFGGSVKSSGGPVIFLPPYPPYPGANATAAKRRVRRLYLQNGQFRLLEQVAP